MIVNRNNLMALRHLGWPASLLKICKFALGNWSKNTMMFLFALTSILKTSSQCQKLALINSYFIVVFSALYIFAVLVRFFLFYVANLKSLTLPEKFKEFKRCCID